MSDNRISCCSCGRTGTVEHPVMGNAMTGLYHCRNNAKCRAYYDTLEARKPRVGASPKGDGRGSPAWIAANKEKIREGLAALMEVQHYGASFLPEDLQGYDQQDFRNGALAFFVELAEFVNSTSWKPWRKPTIPGPEETQHTFKEFADVLHMLAWLLNNLETRYYYSPGQFASAFMWVHQENINRFKSKIPGREPPTSGEAPALEPWMCRKCTRWYSAEAKPAVMNGSRGSDCKECSGWPAGTDANMVVSNPDPVHNHTTDIFTPATCRGCAILQP
jgi:hypothetical protein